MRHLHSASGFPMLYIVSITVGLLLTGLVQAKDSGDEVVPSFHKDILPILRSNCIACHNLKQAEGGLNLESLAGILAGGDSGPMVSVSQPKESLLLARVRGELGEIMPPEDNAVGARPLTEAEFLLIERWIAGGAKGDLIAQDTEAKTKAKWQPLPAHLRSVYALAASPIESVVAVGRGNTIAIVDANSGEVTDQLIDPDLSREFDRKVAHLDFVNALAFSPDGERLVSGGYRTLKVWRRSSEPNDLGELESLVKSLVNQTLLNQTLTEKTQDVSDQQQQQVAEWFRTSNRKSGMSKDELELDRWQVSHARQTTHGEFLKGLTDPANERVAKEKEASQKADEAHAKKADELSERKKSFDAAMAKREDLKALDPPASDEQIMAAEKELEAARNNVNNTEKELAALAQAVASAKDGYQRAIDGLNELNHEIALNEGELEQLQTAIEERTASIQQKSIAAIGFNADQTLAAAAINDGTILVFQTASGTPIRRFSASPVAAERIFMIDSWVIAIGKETISENSPAISDATSVADIQPTFAVWNLHPRWELERVVGTPDGPSPFVDRVTALDFSPDGKWLVVGGGEPSRTGILHVLDTRDYSIASTWDRNHSDIVLSVKISPDSKRLASSGADKQIRVVDFPSGENMRSLEGHTHHVLGVAWQDHARRLASVSADRTIKVWNVRAGEAERTINSGNKELTGIAFVGQGVEIAVTSGEGTVRLYNTDNGGQVRSYNQANGFQQSVIADPSGAWLAAGSIHGGLRIWPVESTEPQAILD